MIFSPHTFELTLTPSSERFQKLKDNAYKKAADKKHRMFQSGKKCVDMALAEDGVKVEYHNDKYKKKIKVIVNPTRVLDGDDVIKLWKPKKNNISKLLNILEKHIAGYFDSEYALDKFKLTRMDFTVNVDVGNNKNVSAYIKVLRRIGKVKGFALKYDRDNDQIDKNLSFDLEGNSNGIEFTAYDKEAQSNRKEAEGILRIEIRLARQKAIRNFTAETVTTKQIADLALKSQGIFLDTFLRIVPCGDFYKKPQAVAVIQDKIPEKKHQKKMLQLLDLVPVKKSLLLAQKEMKDRNIDKVMRRFDEINVSPVTIGKRQEVSHLKNLYAYLLQ